MSYLATLKYDPDRKEYAKPDERGEVWVGTWDQALGDVLGFCSCGAPETALGYVLRILRVINMKHPESGGLPYDTFKVWYDAEYRPAVDAIFHGDAGAEYLAYYLLTDKELIEHGGSVPGWLTELGENVLADLEAHASELLK